MDPGAVYALAGRLTAIEEAVAAAATRLTDHTTRLADANAQADDRIGRMEMLLASLEDLEEESADRLLQGSDPTRGSSAVEPAERLPSFRAARQVTAGGGA